MIARKFQLCEDTPFQQLKGIKWIWLKSEIGCWLRAGQINSCVAVEF
jgi:hypothetical protein